MKRRYFNLIVLFTGIIVLSACSKSDDPELELHKYELSLEEIAIVGQEVGIRMETVEEFNCSNYILELDVAQTDNEAAIHVGDIIEPAECLTSVGPATGKDKISGIDNDLSIVVHADGQTISGTLNVTETEFVLTLQENDLIRLGNHAVSR